MFVSPTEFAIALVTITIGATLQGSVGFGLAVVAAPILLLMHPVWVPGPTLFAAMLVTILIAYRHRDAIVAQEVGLATVGRILGTLPAAYALSALPAGVYNVLFAVVILLGVLLSAAGWHIAPTRRNVVLAATLSGFAGTVSSVGGPPLALVYQNEKGPRVRGTMSAIFVIGTMISIAGLRWAGKFGLTELVLGLALAPGVVVGFAISRYTAAWLDLRHTRPAILAVSALSAVVILIRAFY